MAEPHKKTVQGTPVGELLFKILMKISVIDTGATSSNLGENLIKFETYTTTVKPNINTFNHNVKVEMKVLKESYEREYELMCSIPCSLDII